MDEVCTRAPDRAGASIGEVRREGGEGGVFAVIGCVVMASGEGKRFRASGGTGNKLLADAGGEALIVRTARSVPLDAFEVVVSTRWPDAATAVRAAAPGARLVLHDGALRSDSVRAGLAVGAGRWSGCLFLPGDQPLVRRASFLALARAFEADPARAYRLAWRGAPASPVLFPARCFPALLGLSGKDGGQSVLKAADGPEVALVDAADGRELLDVDTVDDLRQVIGF